MQIDSNNKRVLIVGDIHQEVDKLKKIIRHEAPDTTVTTGDWFDSFHYDTDADVRRAAMFLLANRNNPSFVSCVGNHDVHYLWPNRSLRCSGFTDHKDTLIYETLEQHYGEVRDKLQWYVWVDDWMVSHAGLNIHHIPPMTKLTKAGITEWMESAVAHNVMALNNGGESWFTQAGSARGGRFKHGGLVWQDFDLEFEPIDDLKQIVGHTPHPTILAPKQFGGMHVLDSSNLDVDCHLNQYLIVHNQKLELKNTIDI